ncbi:NAD(P)-binding protein [Streptomyces sp. ISL-43]|uniref:NAD(P)-binding protein n=1 Tax=Streptomyces sp. ISL-43 TaxID=2819183 RepID=UPI001BE7B2C5|nr:NAD(P)-binding protein [Streptomyces sp. ISL-43]MBT2452813.1 NAD(P)-binding protein [Streptomyces sp. ISL-43]
MSPSDEPLLIVGAGIGGLAAAAALARREIPYTLVEALPRPTAVATSILLQNNTVRVLGELGLGGQLSAVGRRVTGTSIRSLSGRILASVGPAAARARRGPRVTPAACPSRAPS